VVGQYTLGCRGDSGGQTTLDVTVGPHGARVTVRLA